MKGVKKPSQAHEVPTSVSLGGRLQLLNVACVLFHLPRILLHLLAQHLDLIISLLDSLWGIHRHFRVMRIYVQHRTQLQRAQLMVLSTVRKFMKQKHGEAES